jgi:hypothetical protein
MIARALPNISPMASSVKSARYLDT